MLNLVVREKLEVTGRGTIFLVSLAENKLNYYKKLVGQLLEYNDQIYRIIGIETHMLLTYPPRPKDIIGLVVRPEQPQEDRFTYKHLY